LIILAVTRRHKLIVIGAALSLFISFFLYEQIQNRRNVYVLSEVSTGLPSPLEQAASLSGSEGSREATQDETTGVIATIVVHIEGQVASPGVYELNEGARVNDLIQLAGGLTEDANRKLNLAQKLHDEAFIYVYAIDEAPASSLTNQSLVTFQTGVTSAGNSLVNINTADLKTLETLPGIGPSLAQRIIDYREQHGPFKALVDLKKVSGIGDKRFEDLESKITR